MPKKRDLAGTRFGLLEAVKRVPGSKWMCRCDCGGESVVPTRDLMRGRTQSCGCNMRCNVPSPTHGHATDRNGKSPTYTSWQAMKARCGHDWYYRNVSVCERWESFEGFLADMGERPGPDYCLSRANDTGNYEPGNVEWALKKENSRDGALRNPYFAGRLENRPAFRPRDRGWRYL